MYRNKKYRRLINFDEYNESMQNEYTLEGIVGSVYDKPKYITFYCTNVRVYDNKKSRHTYRCLIWKSDFKTLPNIKYGDRVILKGYTRMAKIEDDNEEKRIEEHVVKEISFK